MFKVARISTFLCFALLLSIPQAPARAVMLEQIISHENPALSPVAARLNIGRDGLVYIHHQRSATADGYMLRLTPDGGLKSGTVIHYASHGVAANARGEYVVGEAHFAHTAEIFDKNFARMAAVTDFKGTAYTSPQHVEVGASNDFYASDTTAGNIRRFTSSGKSVTTIPTAAIEFRVGEKNDAVYLARGGNIECVGIDGTTRWSVPAPGVGGDTYNSSGGFDVDDNGVLYVISPQSEKVQSFDKEGKPLREIALQMGENKPTSTFRIVDLRVWKDEIFIKRAHPTSLFERYDLNTGAFKKSVAIDYENLTANYPSQIWTAGGSVPFTIRFSNSQNKPAPQLRVWATPFGASRYREFSLRDGQLQIPDDAGGLYQIKVTPETTPQQRRAPSQYLLRDVIEIRQPNSKGTVNLWTPDNRVAYARGEVVPYSVSVRSADADRPREVTVRLIQGSRVLAESKSSLPATNAPLQMTLSSGLTSMLRAGEYSLFASAPNLTSVPQVLTIGNGPDDSPFHLTQFGDYGTDMSYDLSLWDAPDVTSFYGQRSKRLGLNMISERVRTPQLDWNNINKAEFDELVKRLEKDPLGVAPEKARFASPYLQSMAAFGALGIEHMPILLGNDSSTTLGTGFDPRTPAQFTKDIQDITRVVKDYPAFRGWDWAANWWATTAGADAATSPEQKKAYSEALAKARATGEWSAVLGEVANLWLCHAPEDTRIFNDALKQVAQGKVTAVAAPYRNAYAYPPITFENVDEVDLHFQSEQLYPPYSYLHDVDFYKRPGKPAWAHPEIWNDSGTGEQVLRELFGLAMRGADGVGFSGSAVFNGIAQPEDSRSAYNGTTSVHRAALGVLQQYGPWLTSLQNSDRVAIVASPRMFMLDEWSNTWGTHFARVLEAYITCLNAHQPASIVFVDDMKPDTLAKYKAILLVGQRIEMEPMQKTALQNARAAGVKIFYDGTCRESLVKEYTPLGISFDKVEKDPHTWGDDPAFAPYRFPAYIKANLPALSEKLNAALAPVADTDNPEVLFTERTAGEGRYLFALNSTTPELDPGQMWRFSLFVSTRVPVKANVKLNSGGAAIYDVFAQKRVTPQNGQLEADLRDLPMRVFAVLPASIARVGLRGPQSVQAGQSFNCGAWVQGENGAAIKTAIPVRLRLLDSSSRVLDERFLSANAADGAPSTLTVPLDTSGNLSLEAAELFSGKTARLSIATTAATLPLSLQPKAPPIAAMGSKAAEGGAASTPVESQFGPHIRDITISKDGSLAVMNAFNWNENLYGLDVATGKVRWQKRFGQAFTFAPQAISNGLAVQGFDFTSPYSYYMYLADNNGVASRRFGLYGLSRRLPQRFLAGWVNDRMNQFAVAPDGSWVASQGDLGLAVWDKSGKLLWKRDDYKSTHNGPRFDGLANWGASRLVTPVITAQGTSTLLVVADMETTAYDAATGKESWSTALATSGETRKVLLSSDGKTTAVLATTEGGRVFILRGGKLVETIPLVADDIALSEDGSRIVAVNSTQLSLYEIGKGLRWVFNGDEILHNPSMARDGRVAVASNLGTLSVLSPDGQLLHQRDTKSLATSQWLPDGDLLVATWMGDAIRLDAKYSEKWRTHLKPQDGDMRGKLLAAEKTPTAEVNSWTNAEKEPAAITPNLLNQTSALITLTINTRKSEALPILSDGKANAPENPLTGWGNINWLGEGTAVNWIEMEMPKFRTTVSGITFFEDAAHPESWLRDAYLEYYDDARKEWIFALPLLSNSAVHTHNLAKSITANRWRVVLPVGVVGNVRLGEIVMHGTAVAEPKV